jgi:N-acetylmuramoyl-L-alanine amidase
MGSNALGFMARTPTIHQHPSPNCGPRKIAGAPDMMVIHYTAMDSAAAAIERLCDPQFEVSAHYVIDTDGTITQLVPEELRAWHAGAGAWGEVCDVNSHSIGIELDYCPPFEGRLGFDARQIDALQGLMADIMRRRPEITIDGVIGHSDMAPARKFDPGPDFPWKQLADAGLSVWPKNVVDVDPDWDAFKTTAQSFGYRPPVDDVDGWNAVLFAFRTRFNPTARGDLSARDMGIIKSLICA